LDADVRRFSLIVNRNASILFFRNGTASGFYLELKFKAQNLSRLKSAWAISPEIYFRIKAAKYGNLRFSAFICVP